MLLGYIARNLTAKKSAFDRQLLNSAYLGKIFQKLVEVLSYRDLRPRVVSKLILFFGGLECIGHTFACAACFVLLGSNLDFSGLESRLLWVRILTSMGSNPDSLGSNPGIYGFESKLSGFESRHLWVLIQTL